MYVCYSLNIQIKQSIQELGSLLAKVSGTGQVSLSQPSQRNTIQQESDAILRPLMDFLDGRSASVTIPGLLQVTFWPQVQRSMDSVQFSCVLLQID